MLEHNSRVLAAVSGGPDSVAMLHVLVSLRSKYNLTLSAAHLNHMIRGRDADEDARCAEEISKKLGLPFFCARKNVPLFMKKTSLSPEEAARKVRYNFLEKIAKDQKADKIAIGQTADDQAETVLLALIRGTGIAGLSGIPPTRSLEKSAAMVIRPLIEVSRQEIEKYLEAKKITARLDASNLKPVYLRNKIRLELLPMLETNYSPNIKTALVKLADILREDNQFILEETKKLVPKMLIKNNGGVKLDLHAIKTIPLPLQQRLVRKAVNTISGNTQPLSVNHWEQIKKLMNSGRTGSYLTLPGTAAVRKEYNSLLFVPQKYPKNAVEHINCELNVPGRNYIPETGWTIDTSLLEHSGNFPKGMEEAVFDYDRIHFPLRIRFRKAGDRFHPFGMKGSKKLKDYFIDRKVPAGERNTVPLLSDKRRIIWVMDPEKCGYGIISEKVKVTGKTARILQIKFAN